MTQNVWTDVTLGADIVDIRRVSQSYERFGLRFFHKILTSREFDYCAPKGTEVLHVLLERKRFLRRAASRFAAKEATAKALSVGIKGLSQKGAVQWKEIEVRTALPETGPGIILHGSALALAEQKHIRQWRLSLSHDGDMALATVLGLIQSE